MDGGILELGRSQIRLGARSIRRRAIPWRRLDRRQVGAARSALGVGERALGSEVRKEENSVTDPKRMLEDALSAMENVSGALQRAQHAAGDSHEIILAATELSDAKANVRQALRALPDIDASLAGR